MNTEVNSDPAVYGQIVTANDLLAGDVVYKTLTGTWTREIENAQVLFTEQETQSVLAEAQKQVDRIVDAYPVKVLLDKTGEPVPVHYREKIRKDGPSSCSDLSFRYPLLQPDNHAASQSLEASL